MREIDIPDEDLPPRVKAAEERRRIRELIDASSLGTPGVKAVIKISRWELGGARCGATYPGGLPTLRAGDLGDLSRDLTYLRRTAPDDDRHTEGESHERDQAGLLHPAR